MDIIQVGLSHKTAPVEIRERLAIPPAGLPAALQALCPANGNGPGDVLEGAILSTCNRLEVYAVVEEAGRDQGRIVDYLEQLSGVPRAGFEPHLRCTEGQEAVAHLCAVACGLDSLVLGESQIQGQVAEAHEAALCQGTAGIVLNALFRTALRAGKRARSETAINEHAASISHVAVELASQVFDDLHQKQALLIGAGEMAELAAKNLVDHGVGVLRVINRSAGRAAALARQFGGEALGWERLGQALWGADIVISSTGAPHAILRVEAVAAAMHMRRNRPLLIIDIAVPRDVEPGVGDLPNVFLYDIDDLQGVIEANLAQRQREVPRVQAIIREEVAAFMAWFRARDVVPTIVDLRHHVQQICDAELHLAMRRFEHLPEHERNAIIVFSQRLVNKILHHPTVRLKEHANGRDAYRYTETLRDLFGLSTPGDENGASTHD